MITTLDGAWDYLKSLILDNQPFTSHPEIPFARAVRFLGLLGNPQNNMKVIHIAGTSGKGSTAHYMSRLLAAHGFKVGLHISPHLIDIRERFQINNRMVTDDVFIAYLNKVKEVSDAMEKTQFGHASYFEALVGLSFLLFSEEKVDYAVIETGMGGRYDGTNTVTRTDKFCILTPIGLDHTNVLGKTLPEIAFQKAKIMHAGNLALASYGPDEVRQVFETVAHDERATLTYLKPDDFRNVRLQESRVIYDFYGAPGPIIGLKLNTPALYQAQNSAIALKALFLLAVREGFAVSEKKVRNALEQTAIAGRMDMARVEGHDVLFDGAHNPQKMRAFLDSLSALFPGRKFRFLVAFKRGKDFREMVKMIGMQAVSVTATRFIINIQDSNHLSEDEKEVASALRQSNPHMSVSVLANPHEAFTRALSSLGDGEFLVVTGSLYLISCLYPHERTPGQ